MFGERSQGASVSAVHQTEHDALEKLHTAAPG
jgi:hypothetical protein